MLLRIRQHVDSERKLVRFKFPGIASIILRNKSALVMEIVQPPLAFKLFACENVAFYTKQDFLFHLDTSSMVEVLPKFVIPF